MKKLYKSIRLDEDIVDYFENLAIIRRESFSHVIRAVLLETMLASSAGEPEQDNAPIAGE